MKLLPLLIVSSVMLAACSSTENASQTNSTGTVESQQTQTQTGGGDTTQSQSTTIDISSDNYSFSTKEITVSQGSNVTINFTNTQGSHDFVIDELNVNSGMLSAGDSKELTIPTDKPGKYEFYCSVPGHKQMGMVGTLIIE